MFVLRVQESIFFSWSELNSPKNMSCSSNAILQIVAVGAQDKYLTQNSNITFWRMRHMRYTNFALESAEQQWSSGGRSMGEKVSLRLNRNGDLVYHMYVKITLPALANVVDDSTSCYNGFEVVANEDEVIVIGGSGDAVAATDGCNGRNTIPRYTNAVGHAAIKEASVTVGGQTLDTLYSDYLYMWEELTGKPGKKLGEQIGKAKTTSLGEYWTKFQRTLYVPLPFFFTMTSGTVLPLVSLQFHDVKVNVTFNPIEHIIVNYNACFDGVKTKTVVRENPTGGRLAPIKASSSLTAVTSAHVQTALEVTYVYLDTDERQKFAEGSFEQLIQRTQQLVYTTSQPNNRIRLDFNHCLIELIWAVRKASVVAGVDHFNYAGITEPITSGNRDPVKSACLKLNNQNRFCCTQGEYFRLIQPLQHHTNVPESFVYCYSFSLNPEDVQPSGSLNASRIDNVTLEINLDPDLFKENSTHTSGPPGNAKEDTVDIIIYARNLNVLRVGGGLGGLAYSN